MKKCPKCGGVLENQNTKIGSYCRACRNAYNKSHYRKNPRCYQQSERRLKERIRAVVIAAKSKPCTDCGNIFPWYVMDFDHVRGEKVIALSLAANKHLSKVKLEAEIAKCEVVCANCHRIRTFQRAGSPTYTTAVYETADLG